MATQLVTQYSFEAGDGQMDYFFLGGSTNHTMKSVIDDYSQITGRPTMLPKRAMGYHLGRFRTGTGRRQYIAPPPPTATSRWTLFISISTT